MRMGSRSRLTLRRDEGRELMELLVRRLRAPHGVLRLGLPAESTARALQAGYDASDF